MGTKNGNGHGHEGGGVAVELPAKASDMAAIMEALDQMPDESVRSVRRTIELFNDGTYDRYMAEHGAKCEGHEDDGGVAEEDLAAIDAGLKQMSDETVRAICDLIEPADSDDDRTRLVHFFAACLTNEKVASIRRTIATYNSEGCDAFATKYDEADQDIVRACLPQVDKAILQNKIVGILRECKVEFLAGLEHFLTLAREAVAA